MPLWISLVSSVPGPDFGGGDGEPISISLPNLQLLTQTPCEGFLYLLIAHEP